MATYRVRFLPMDKTVEVDSENSPPGHDGEPGSLLRIALAHGIELDHACGGVCACSTCHVYVTKGFDKLSEIEDEEFDILDKAFDVRSTSRLGCQAKIEDPEAEIEVEISGESFQAFLDEHPDEKDRALALRKA
jgi:2Fe-2S ferredoxin